MNIFRAGLATKRIRMIYWCHSTKTSLRSRRSGRDISLDCIEVMSAFRGNSEVNSTPSTDAIDPTRTFALAGCLRAVHGLLDITMLLATFEARTPKQPVSTSRMQELPEVSMKR